MNNYTYQVTVGNEEQIEATVAAKSKESAAMRLMTKLKELDKLAFTKVKLVNEESAPHPLPETILDWTDEWHEGLFQGPINEFFGWTEKEYGNYVIGDVFPARFVANSK